jgi:hypothetical protein
MNQKIAGSERCCLAHNNTKHDNRYYSHHRKWFVVVQYSRLKQIQRLRKFVTIDSNLEFA